MTGVVRRTEFIYENEILRSSAGDEDVLSCVLDASRVNTTFSEIPGRYFVPLGAVMVWVGTPFASKVAPVFMNDGTTGQGTTIAVTSTSVAGILSRSIELLVGDETPYGASPTEVSDQDASLFHHGCRFNVSKLVGYNPAVDLGNDAKWGTRADHGSDNSAAIKAALKTCLFQ